VPEFDAGRTLADRMRAHAGHDTHLYGELMRSMADDWEANGPVRDICAGWEDAPAGAVVQLRLLAGLFRIVLTGGAPGLVQYYPCLGGTEPAADAWPKVRQILSAHVEELQAALEIAPQTNEPGRSTALLVGLFAALRRTDARRVRLLEPGASAGLNLLLDYYRFEEDTWTFGPPASPLVLRRGVVGGVEPVGFTVVARRGCDLAPVDASTAEGRLRLRSFVWPFDIERHERLTAALEVAAAHPVDVDTAPASQWLRDALAQPAADGVLTVVWQSVTRLYWPPEEIAAVDEIIGEAGRRQTLAHVAMEFPPTDGSRRAVLTLGALPGIDEAVALATVGDHGRPVWIQST
jgi:hypothetical protein